MFTKTDILSLRSFEICSIRPPTENSSLTFRLTRNCYWNRCRFCPVYKTGSAFSRRSIKEIREDIARARAMDDFMFENGMGYPVYSHADFGRVPSLADSVTRAHHEAGILGDVKAHDKDADAIVDSRLAWFSSWFDSNPGIAGCMNHILSWRIAGGATCFLGDADSLILSPDFVHETIDALRSSFSSIRRIAVYGRTSTASRRKTVKDLRAFKQAGIDRVHFGLESGSDRVLSFMEKGVTAAEHIDGCLKAKEAGLSCSVYVMPGLGGSELSEIHAVATSELLTRIAPEFVRLRTLEIFPGTRVETAVDNGEFIEATEEATVKEIRTIVEQTECATEILSGSASNLLDISGKLPGDRRAMLADIDGYLSLDPRKKLEFSLHARIRSCIGQYGGLPEDVHRALLSHVRRDRLMVEAMDNDELQDMIRLIRSKLMP